jgi:RimJ/RimL family protein N-acetyltransferase
LDSDPEVMRLISKGEPPPWERIEREIMPLVLGYYRAWPPQGFWIAHLKETDDFIGWFHLRPDKIVPEEMEMGYRLKRNAWGRGLATEGAQALVSHALNDWSYPKVCARTLAINLASRRVMEKAGLTFESEFVWAQDTFPEWTAEERRGVKYATELNPA